VVGGLRARRRPRACPTTAVVLLAPVLVAAEHPRTAVERLQPSHLEAVRDQRIRWMRDRVNIPLDGIYHDYRAVIHVHAEDAPHTLGTREQVLQAAKASGVDVVLWTDHKGPKPDTWHGLRNDVLFIPGSEDDHALRFPSPAGDLKFWSHLEEISDPQPDGFDGTEIYNRHADAEIHKEVYDYVRHAIENKRQWHKLVENFKQFPDEVFGAGTDSMPGYLAKWDALTSQRRFTGIGANDAHRNQVFEGTVFDPYEVAFRNLSTHILARGLNEESIRESLRDGHVYVAHDWLCDPSGFLMVAVNNLGLYDIGDRVPMAGTTVLQARLPVPAKIRIIRTGKVVWEGSGEKAEFTPQEEGAYRLEAWLTVDDEERPWIYTNPFYLHRPTAEDIRVPSAALGPGITVERNIDYAEGKPEDADKHRLDIYLPAERKNSPVLMFVHGGYWRQGDRAQYAFLGNRFAEAGYVVAMPSYRLMPANPHPAQIEDVAAAFAWTHENISKYGGDPARIIVAGHSAGGHLASLLALDPQWLRRFKLSPDAIRAVVSLSGVYDLSRVPAFGGEATRAAASPIRYARPDAPPFLIEFCQWDYPGLPAQARRMDAELRKAFVRSRMVYGSGENHISEILDLVNGGNPVTSEMLKFMAFVTTSSPDEK
jgi:acetyl esterase/lipase